MGPAAKCEWLRVGRMLYEKDSNKIVTACRLVDSKVTELVTPIDWKFEGSLSQTFGFVPTEHADRSLKFIRQETSVDIFESKMTGKDVFQGRTK